MATDQNPSGVTITTEVDTPNGWSFQVEVRQQEAPPRSITLRMSWADFEHWSGGTIPPSDVARAVVELAIDRKPEAVCLGDFDAAMLRRWFDGADEALRAQLQRDA